MSETTTTEVIGEASKWTAGAGILLLALAPLSLPIIALTVVALIPLAVPALVLGLIAAVVIVPVRLLRRVLARGHEGGAPARVASPSRTAAAGRP